MATKVELKVSPDGERIAVLTGPSVTAGKYFVYSPDHGGGYTSGAGEGVENWVDVELPAAEEPAQEPASQ